MSNRPWVKLWTDDLWASANFQSLTVYQKGIYSLLLGRCRKEDYPGQFRQPNGNPLDMDKIIDLFLPQQGDRRDRIKEVIAVLVEKGMLLWTSDEILEIRKFAEKSQKRGGEVAGKLSGGEAVPHYEPPVERKKKKDMKKNNKNSIYQSLFNYWNLQGIANHRKLTNKMKRSINGRLDEGFTEDELKQAMANYAKILKSEEYWWTHRWTALVDFLNRGIDKFKDWSVAHINYLQSDKKLASLKDKKEAQFEAELLKIITNCKKCDGKGSTPGENGTHECACRKRVKELRKEHNDTNKKA